MKKRTLLLSLLLLVLLVACGDGEPADTPLPPTEAPTPTAEGSYVDNLEHTPDPNLVDISWQWERRDNADGSNAITISDPDNYQLLFNDDGTFSARLDCNSANGRYATSSPGAIFMELGPSTRAACPEGSQADAMTQMFGPARDYRFEEDGTVLVFSWAAGGPVDYYRNATAVSGDSTDDGSMVDQIEHVADPNLINITWAWERRDPNGNEVPAIDVPNPENYTLQFNEDGSFNAKIDCNLVSGRYATHDNGGIFMELGLSTLAICGEDSLADSMMGIFGGAVQDYRFEEDGAVLVFSWAAGGPIDYYRSRAYISDDSTDDGSMVDQFEHVADPNLINVTWAWERRDPNGNEVPAIDVPNPENYTLQFNEDDSFNGKIDCNEVGGRYATQDNGGIFMELGMSSMATCGEDSLADSMMGIFGGAVQDYRFEDDGATLVFSWAAGGPIDYYRNVSLADLPDPAEGAPTGTVIAPDGVFLRTGPGANYPFVGAAPFGDSGEIFGISQDGQWWLAAAPNLPGGQVWVSASFVEVTNAENVPVVNAPDPEPTLTGTPWQWVSTTTPVGTTTVDNPSSYTIFFNEDGQASIQADCNTVLANYTVDDSSITITLGASTLALCPPESLGDQFTSQLSSAVIYFIQGGNLYLDMPVDSGTMRFVPQGTPPPSSEAPSNAADGNTLYLVSFGPQGAETPIIPGTQITLLFSGDRATGNADCNNYSGTVKPVNDYFVIENILTTRKFCEENVMAQEQAYLTALANITGYQWEQQLQGNSMLVTQGQIFYSLSDDTTGAMNFVASP